jgi:hypothetical protein
MYGITRNYGFDKPQAWGCWRNVAFQGYENVDEWMSGEVEKWKSEKVEKWNTNWT